MKISMWFVIVTTFAVGVAFGQSLPFLQRMLYLFESWLHIGIWGPAC